MKVGRQLVPTVERRDPVWSRTADKLQPGALPAGAGWSYGAWSGCIQEALGFRVER